MICLSGHIRPNPAMTRRPKRNGNNRRNSFILNELWSFIRNSIPPYTWESGHNPDIGTLVDSCCGTTAPGVSQPTGQGSWSYVPLMCSLPVKWAAEAMAAAKLNGSWNGLAPGFLALADCFDGIFKMFICNILTQSMRNLQSFDLSLGHGMRTRADSGRILMCRSCALPPIVRRFVGHFSAISGHIRTWEGVPA